MFMPSDIIEPMSARIDLHTHSSCSDGLLTPAALVARAAAREVELLALTDHDTVAGCAGGARRLRKARYPLCCRRSS